MGRGRASRLAAGHWCCESRGPSVIGAPTGTNCSWLVLTRCLTRRGQAARWWRRKAANRRDACAACGGREGEWPGRNGAQARAVCARRERRCDAKHRCACARLLRWCVRRYLVCYNPPALPTSGEQLRSDDQVGYGWIRLFCQGPAPDTPV